MGFRLAVVALVLSLVMIGALGLIWLISEPMFEELLGLIPGSIRWPVVAWWQRKMQVLKQWQMRRELRSMYGATYGGNRLLSTDELMEREALKRGICPECGRNVKGFGGYGPDGLACPYHTERED